MFYKMFPVPPNAHWFGPRQKMQLRLLTNTWLAARSHGLQVDKLSTEASQTQDGYRQ